MSRTPSSLTSRLLAYGCIVLAGAVVASAGIAAIVALWSWIL